jgi:hypothetical protein
MRANPQLWDQNHFDFAVAHVMDMYDVLSEDIEQAEADYQNKPDGMTRIEIQHAKWALEFLTTHLAAIMKIRNKKFKQKGK